MAKVVAMWKMREEEIFKPLRFSCSLVAANQHASLGILKQETHQKANIQKSMVNVNDNYAACRQDSEGAPNYEPGDVNRVFTF